MSENGLYTDYKTCLDLKVKEKCFRLQKYIEGHVRECFHEHIPKHRISTDGAAEFMKALILRQSTLGDSEMLRTYINQRGKNPRAIQLGQVIVEYPEQGVIRKYFSSGNTAVWYDEVISPENFRLKRND